MIRYNRKISKNVSASATGGSAVALASVFATGSWLTKLLHAVFVLPLLLVWYVVLYVLIKPSVWAFKTGRNAVQKRETVTIK